MGIKQGMGQLDLLFDENTSHCKVENGLKGYGLKGYQSESEVLVRKLA